MSKYKYPIDPRDRKTAEEREWDREVKNTSDEYYKDTSGISSAISIFGTLLSIFGGGRGGGGGPLCR